MSTQPVLARFGKGREDTIVKRGGEEVAAVDGADEIEVRIPSDGEKEGEMGVQSSWLVTNPISMAGPNEADLQRTRQLEEV